MIVCNGIPKSGTHLLVSYCEGLGMYLYPDTVKGYGSEIEGLPHKPLPHSACHAHIPAKHARRIPHRVVTIFRHPRDVLMSYCRAFEVSALEALASYLSGRPFVELYEAFLPWRQHGVTVYFEQLAKTCRSSTYSGRRSYWQDQWTDEIEQAWRSAGGPRLEQALGYA